MSRALWLLIPALAVAGCATTPLHPQLPRTVTVEVVKYVPLDPKLLQPCPIAEPQNLSVAEAVRVARARKAALEDCNDDKAAIRTAQPPGEH